MPTQQRGIYHTVGGAGRDAVAGVAAQLMAGFVYTPLDIIKERLQVRGGQCWAVMQVHLIAVDNLLVMTGLGGVHALGA